MNCKGNKPYHSHPRCQGKTYFLCSVFEKMLYHSWHKAIFIYTTKKVRDLPDRSSWWTTWKYSPLLNRFRNLIEVQEPVFPTLHYSAGLNPGSTSPRFGISAKLFLPRRDWKKWTSNVEWKKMKKQTYDLEERLLEFSVRIIKIVEQLQLRFSLRVSKRLKKNRNNRWVFGIGCLFFHSMLDVRCSMFDVHLLKQARMA